MLVNAGQNVTGINFILDSQATISGKLLAPDGVTGVANSFVYLQQMVMSGTFTYTDTIVSSKTDANGNYMFNARTGTYVVQAAATDYPLEYYMNALTPETAAPLTLSTGINLTGINLVLDSTWVHHRNGHRQRWRHADC